jgi:subtilisin family serine protease
MSFGFKDEVPVIRDSINRAATRAPQPCLLFAAASNFAVNEDVQWPASHDRVICVHAADGLGNKHPRNVTQEQPWKEFATLGCDVEAFVGPGQQAIKSGTSVASPVAAGLAALILGEVLMNKTEYLTWLSGDCAQQAKVYNEKLYRLRTREGMSNVLMSLSISRDNYNCLRPWKLLHKNYGHKCLRVEKIIDTAAGGKPVHV